MSKSVAYSFLAKDIQDQVLAALSVLDSVNISVAPDGSRIAANSFMKAVQERSAFFVWWAGPGPAGASAHIVGHEALNQMLKYCTTLADECKEIDQSLLSLIIEKWKLIFKMLG